MPELPEVEIVCRNLSEILKPGTSVEGWHFFRKDLRFEIPRRALQALKGQVVHKIERRAKYILFFFDEKIMISHLGMTGAWREEPSGWTRRKHDHLALEFSPKRFLVFEDARRFGFVEVIAPKDLKKRFEKLGAEPLDTETDFSQLTEKFRELKSPIKSALMNQKLLVGVGNIYASESLFRAGISPLLSCSKISLSRYEILWKKVAEVLGEAIEKGGSTIENYRNGFGEEGRFQSEFFVYGRAGDPCVKCHTQIKTRVQAGRSTFWCPNCQKK